MAAREQDADHRARDRHSTDRRQAWSRFESELEENRTSRRRHGSIEAIANPSPDRPTGLELHPASLDRKAHLAEQGWVEKIGRSGGRRITSWSIKRIDAENPPEAQKPAAEKPSTQPQLRYPSPTKGNAEAASFLERFGEVDGKDSRVGGLPVEQHNEVMAELAMKNSKDDHFQDRFAAMLAKHEGRKVPADAANNDHEGGNYDADTSNVSEIGGDNDMSKDQVMEDATEQKNNYNALEERFAKELVERKKERVLVPASKFYSGGSNGDADMSSFEAAPRRQKSSESKSQRVPEKEGAKGQLETLSAEIAEYKNMDRRSKNEIVLGDDGNPVPRWVKFLKDQRNEKKLARGEREESKRYVESRIAEREAEAKRYVEKLRAKVAENENQGIEWKDEIVYDENGKPIPRWVKIKRDKREAKKQAGFKGRFNEILAKHDGKRNQNDNGKMDFEMGDETTMVDNRSDFGSKRKREDEDELMESMQHMRVETGRKRSRNVDPADFPINLAMERTRLSPERQRDSSPPRRSVDRWGQPLRDSYRPVFSPERRPAEYGMKKDLDLDRIDRNIRQRYRSPEQSQNVERRKHSDFISLSDSVGDRLDSRREDRSQGRQWKGFHQDDKVRNKAYRGIMEDLGEFRESRNELDSYRSDRNVRERDRGYLSPGPSQRGRNEKQDNFISFSDPLGDSFGNRREDRTQGKYWKGFHQDDKHMNGTYRVIADDLGEFKESRKQEGEHRGGFHRRCQSPRPSRDLPESIPLREENDEQGEWWGTEDKVPKRDRVKGNRGYKRTRRIL